MKHKAIRITAMAAAGILLLVLGSFVGWHITPDGTWPRRGRRFTGPQPAARNRANSVLGYHRGGGADGGKADFIDWNGRTLVRRDGVSGKPIWDASRPEKPWESNRDPVAWIRRLSYFGDETRPGKLVQPAPDLNGDGTGDLVWVIEGAASILALSGKDGSLLWTYSAKLDGPGGPDPAGPAAAPR